MKTLQEILSVVTDQPVTLAAPKLLPAFPGCEEHVIQRLQLSDGFALGDFMEDDDVSVAQEVFSLDVSCANKAPNKEMLVVWRVAFKVGPVVLLRLRVFGTEESILNNVVIDGVGLIVEDVELEPFLRAHAIEVARKEAFEEVEAAVRHAALMTQQALSLFSSNADMANQAAARLTLARETST